MAAGVAQCRSAAVPGTGISAVPSVSRTLQAMTRRTRDRARNSMLAIYYSAVRRSRSALVMTDTELNVMAAAAIIGLSRMPKNGYRRPAAIGTPITL